ncbi:MAG: hypothetical protein EOM90_00895 [Alphaproteobacteria bacterium]|nr:hypothetical protein [Alphaproteobacteria bacterium]
MILERLKFYADTPKAKNQYFCWKLTSLMSLQDALWRFFDKGWSIRSAWYEKVNTETAEMENVRLNIQEQFDEYIKQKFAPNGKWICIKGHSKGHI